MKAGTELGKAAKEIMDKGEGGREGWKGELEGRTSGKGLCSY